MLTQWAKHSSRQLLMVTLKEILTFILDFQQNKCKYGQMKNLFKKTFYCFLVFFVATVFICPNAYADTEVKDSTNPSSNYAHYADKKQASPKQEKVMTFFGVGRKKAWNNKIVPGMTFNYRKGYTFTIGPKLTHLKAFGDHKALRTSLSYVPLMISNFKAGFGRIGYTDLKLDYTHHLNRKFFYQITYDANHFNPNNSLKNYVKTLGAKIDDDLIHTAALSVGFRIFDIKISKNGRRFPIPIYLKASYRFGKNYKFGTYVADAGNEYDLRNEFKITLWPMLRRF